MALVTYDPFRMLDQIRDEMNQLFENRLVRGRGDVSSAATADWVPAVDIKEETDRFVILADIPGVDAKDLEITMENGVLTLRGQREEQTKEEREGYTRVERVRGTFYRRFTLPDTADSEKISAKTKNGVLELVIPKHERVQPKKISVAATIE